jgi:protein-S-isoprenylcysteine O-methyltransferase Ste14
MKIHAQRRTRQCGGYCTSAPVQAAPLVLGLVLNKKFPVSFLPRRMTRILGWPLLISGVLLWGWFIWALRRADTPISPYESATRPVTDGPFRYTRNPGYLSATLIYAGIASLANALWAILLLPAMLIVLQRGVVKREERYLERKFGEAYLRYKAQVQRWI